MMKASVFTLTLFIQRANSDSEAGKTWTNPSNVLDRLKIYCADLAEGFASV